MREWGEPGNFVFMNGEWVETRNFASVQESDKIGLFSLVTVVGSQQGSDRPKFK